MTEVEVLEELVDLWRRRALLAESKLDRAADLVQALTDLSQGKISRVKFEEILKGTT